MDFRKAFGTVPHCRLNRKLRAYHIKDSLLEWIECFLSERRTLNGQYSGWQEVTAVIPRGSVMGPVLFVVFINDLPLSLKSSEGFMFADDKASQNNHETRTPSRDAGESLQLGKRAIHGCPVSTWTNVSKCTLDRIKKYIITSSRGTLSVMKRKKIYWGH